LAYDVNAKHCNKIRKICKQYLRPVQESVFEGEISGSGLKSLKAALKKAIDGTTDYIRIYELNSSLFAYVNEIGTSSAVIGTVI